MKHAIAKAASLPKINLLAITIIALLFLGWFIFRPF
jgi:hypothetical protein